MKENIENLLLAIGTIEKIYNSNVDVEFKGNLIAKYHIDNIYIYENQLGVNFKFIFGASITGDYFFSSRYHRRESCDFNTQEYLDLYFIEVQKNKKQLEILLGCF